MFEMRLMLFKAMPGKAMDGTRNAMPLTLKWAKVVQMPIAV